jgi:hypothetical protein
MAIGRLPGYISAVQRYAANPAAKRQTQQALTGLLPPTSSTLAAPGIQRVVSGPVGGGQRTNVDLGYQPPAAPGVGGGRTVTTTTRSPIQVYQDEILNNPTSIGGQQAFDAATQGLLNTRQAQFRQALVASGYDPRTAPGGLGDLGDYAGDFNQATLDAAAANPLSARAQLDKALNQSQADLPYALAARGVARSGELPVGFGSLQNQYDVQKQQGLGDLLSALRGYASNYASGYGSAVDRLNAIREQVAQRLAQQQGYSETTTTDYGDGADGGVTTTDTGGGYPPMYAPNLAPQLQTSDPYTASVINKIIKPTRGRVVPKNIFQIARNVRAG